MRIKEADVEDNLDDKEEMTHAEGQCGNCGGELTEMREVWSSADKVYYVNIAVDYLVSSFF